MSKLLKKNPKERLDIEGMKNHPWLKLNSRSSTRKSSKTIADIINNNLSLNSPKLQENKNKENPSPMNDSSTKIFSPITEKKVPLLAQALENINTPSKKTTTTQSETTALTPTSRKESEEKLEIKPIPAVTEDSWSEEELRTSSTFDRVGSSIKLIICLDIE